jgi:hypothetical protein
MRRDAQAAESLEPDEPMLVFSSVQSPALFRLQSFRQTWHFPFTWLLWFLFPVSPAVYASDNTTFFLLEKG